jgi:hypothetical protein
MSAHIRFAIFALLAAAAGIVAWACADIGEEPTWALAKPDYDPGGSAAMLLPSNDTRVNLLLLLADRRGAMVRNSAAKADDPPLVLFPWYVMANRAAPPGEVANDYMGGSRCQTNASGTAAFVAAVRANRQVPDAEKQLLTSAREALQPGAKQREEYVPDVECAGAVLPEAQLAAIQSPAGKAFATYLTGAQQFYAGAFDPALTAFGSLSSAPDPWLRETADYMVARSQLNRAIQKSLNEYGDIEGVEKRDRAGATAAGVAFDSYLKAYPAGLYASSARGLMRRVHWLAGDTGSLAGDYGRQLSGRSFDGAPTTVDFINELDNKLPLPTNSPAQIRDPLLLAVVDLHRMRQPEDASARDYCCGPPITRAEIEAQRPAFGSDTELYDYIRAAEAFFVRKDAREVLQILPDAAHQQRFSYLQFSRQMLRGLALDGLGDSNTRGFWMSLFPGASRPYQRDALELALAMHDEKGGRLDLVFAPDSQVRHPIIRELLLEHVAGPDILRQQARRPGVPKVEREIALYMLLSKELRRGFYSQFLGDLRLLPTDMATDPYFSGGSNYDARWNATQERPPLGVFGPAGKLGDAGCPALAQTASQLVANPRAIRPRLCLAEFFRNNGFDNFNEWGSYDEPLEGTGLATTRQLFPGPTTYSRLELYKAVIADPAATADDKAFALNRAVRCYAPGGNNSCSGTEVELPQRKAWYMRLKREYPQSRWATTLKNYW